MAKNLVIVESPAKVKTIKKFLGSNYEVDASGGHVRDLPKSTLGVDVEHGYEPKYITIRGKGDVLARLRKEVKKADKIYLATDPDREGEAISWHLSRLRVSTPTASTMLQRMLVSPEKLIVKTPSATDARSTLIALTDAGQKYLTDLLPGHFQRVEAFASVLSPEERLELIGLLRKLLVRR